MRNKVNVKSNFVFNSLFQLTNIFVPLITLPYLSRVLHAEGLGAYSFAYSVSYYCYLFIRLGLQNYGNRTIAFVRNDPEKLSATFFEIYATQFFMGIAMTAVYLIYCLFAAPDRVLATIFILLVVAGSIDLTWFLYGLEEFKVTSVRDILTKIITAICIFCFVRDADDVWKYALIYSGGFLANQLVVLPLIAGRVHYVKPVWFGIKSHIAPNLVLFLPTVAVSLYKSMDKIMIGVMSSDAELGFYHSCENIIKVPLALITALGTVMLPRMSNMISNGVNDRDVKELFNKSIKFAMFMSSSICLGMMTVSKEFVPLYYGEGFEKCILLFYIILPSCLFLAFANVIRTQYLLPRKQDGRFIISLFTGAGVNLIINMILIPRLASVGAAIGTLMAEVTVCVVQALFVFKEADIWKNIIDSLPFIASGIVMFLLCRDFAFPIGNVFLALILKVMFCGGVYLIVLSALYISKRLITGLRVD